MLAFPLVVLDLETTGARPELDRITEIGLLEVREGRVVERWSGLVNPRAPIPPFIESLTGISEAMVAQAPDFEDIARALHERLQGRVLVAHNARFDYGFLRKAFERAGIAYRARVLCTAKLSRTLFPEHRRHNLDSLIARHGLECNARHRAMGDAEVLWQFLGKLPELAQGEAIRRAVQAQIEPPELPPGLTPGALEDVPESPGVYVLYGRDDAALHVGRASNLRAALWSRLRARPRARRGAAEQEIHGQTVRLDWTATAGELGALLLEARLAEHLSPPGKRPEEFQLWGWEWAGSLEAAQPVRLCAVERTQLDRIEALFGQFRGRRQAQDALAGIARAQRLCPALLGLESLPARGEACSEHRAARCHGACCGGETRARHDMRLVQALSSLRIRSWPFAGAIALRESAGAGEIHVFDRWCHLGRAASDAQLAELLDAPPRLAFDPGVYRVLRRALDMPRSDIRRLEPEPAAARRTRRGAAADAQARPHSL
ncbi:MAG: hypothetical protein IT514_00450 [Burkholderiales bacterium]|nr:hypothetical protein [Burkholderiales bacterium]